MKSKILLILMLLVGVTSGFNTPNWPLKVISWDIDKAYPGIEYNYRIAVQGGRYPYRFYLTNKPTGMSIDSLTGEIKWIPGGESSNNSVVVKIYNQDRSDSLTHSFTVTTIISGFTFVDSATGNNTNSGSISSPLATWSYASKHTDSSKFIYVRNGTYYDSWQLNSADNGRFLAYPGETVRLISNTSTSKCIEVTGTGKYIFQGFDFNANDKLYFFALDGGDMRNMIFRKNIMHNSWSTGSDNPSFLFFADGSQTPYLGQVHYKDIVVQDNTFYDLVNDNNHGGPCVNYDVWDMLFEDNLVYNIDGGIKDKDDGFKNTFRHNVVHDCHYGVELICQDTQDSIDVSFNKIYNVKTASILIGNNPGWIKDVWVYRNTCDTQIVFTQAIGDDATSGNINVFKNIIGTNSRAYRIQPYSYEWFTNSPPNTKVMIDSNICYSPSNNVAGYDGLDYSWSYLQSHEFDANGLNINPNLDTNLNLSQSSPYWGIFGYNINYHTSPYIDTTGNSYIYNLIRGRPVKIPVKTKTGSYKVKYVLKRNSVFVDSSIFITPNNDDTLKFNGTCNNCLLLKISEANN